MGLATDKNEKVLKEANEVMGGKVLEYEAKTIYKDGVKEGVKEGVDLLLSNLVASGLISEEEAKVQGDIVKSSQEDNS